MNESGNSLRMAYTIEYHLKMFAESEKTTERHQVLWHTWNQNKRWLSQILEWTLSSFQTYSYHNASHAESVLHNIERLLGEERIRQLSASDAFMLLHVAYMHDVGMSISVSEREGMMQDDQFLEMVERLLMEGDADMRKAAENLLKTDYTEYKNVSSRERSKKVKKLFTEKLNVFYGVSQLMAEYQRNMHASKVMDRMHDWTLDPEKLGNGLAVSGIPLRIFLRIADCASIHATSGIEPVLALPKEDSGYVLDTMHPRFVAVMLQLGDALDMDNNRFNPFVFEFAGNFPRTSTLHYKKHHAIRQLNITPQVIEIHADCNSQEVLRLVRVECESIEEILKNASYYWNEIAPEGLSGCLPTIVQNKVLLDGQQVPAELVKAQFNISQVRAFRLLEGANVYGGNFVFLREIIQNAIDASKLQCWEDYIYRCKLKERKILQDEYELVEYGLNASEQEILSEIDVWDYPIELYFEIGMQIQDEVEELKFIPAEEIREKKDLKGKYGVRFTVRDHGTGITKEDLIKISNVGSSYEEKKHFIDKMPDWLKPTGQFGIGLQSVFLVSDSVVARTYTRNGEKYEITFNKVSNGSGGYINVKPLPQDEYLKFGTTFEIFLSNEYKRPHSEFWSAWNTDSEDADRFADDYDKRRPERHAKELMAQMILTIDSLLGENLFPIYARIRGKQFDQKQFQFIKKKIKKLVLEADAAEENFDKDKYISWLFKAIGKKNTEISKSSEDLIIVNIKDGIGALDCSKAKLYIWNSNLGVFAQFGSSRILTSYSDENQITDVDTKNDGQTQIYLKGIYVQNCNMCNDSELLEIIDIKGGKIGKKHISINRNGFTKEGTRYLENVIYPEIMKSVKMILVALNEQANREKEQSERKKERDNESKKEKMEYKSFDEKIMKNIVEKTEACIKEEQKNYSNDENKDLLQNNENDLNENFMILKKELEELVLSAIGLALLLRILGKEKRYFCEKKETGKDNCRWDILLEKIVAFRNSNEIEGLYGAVREVGRTENQFDKYINCGMMKKMQVSRYTELSRNGWDSNTETMDYASLLMDERKIAIISLRQNDYSRWFHIPMIVDEQQNEEGQKKKTENEYMKFVERGKTWEEEEEIQEKLESWGDKIFREFGDNITLQKLYEKRGTDFDVQNTLYYMLSNIPTVALYTNIQGNVRINVLDSEEKTSIFCNKNMKRLILKKIHSLHQNYGTKRFVTPVWRGYECITLDKEPSSVCVVNGAYIARNQQNKMLFPISGDKVSVLLNLQEQSFFRELKKRKEECHRLEEECDRILKFHDKFENAFREEDLTDPVTERIHRYLVESGKRLNIMTKVALRNAVNKYLLDMNLFLKRQIHNYKKQVFVRIEQNMNLPIDELIEKLSSTGQYQQMLIEQYIENLDSEKKENASKVEKNKEMEKLWFEFNQAIAFIRTYQNLDLQKWLKENTETEEFHNSLWTSGSGKSEIQKNMIDYVAKNTLEHLTEKQIERCYEKLFDDMIECVIETNVESDERRYPNVEALF